MSILFKNKTLVAGGVTKNAGYYTVDFDEPVDWSPVSVMPLYLYKYTGLGLIRWL